ncbi:MAG: AAA family ATPase [Candidatus Woesearchaeota archaeon]|nr:AAA family ATPase [Candidatus Woesearchaeota archaeon]
MHTLNRPIYELIGEYEPGKITSIYGNAASGKTTSCLLASLSCAKDNGKVIYIDTENSFSPDRLRQLYFGDINQLIDNIFLMQPKTFDEQVECVEKAKKLSEKAVIKLVIVDSIGNHYRNVLNDDHKLVNSKMAEMMAQLTRIARDLGKIVIITSQVTTTVDGTNRLRVVGGKLIEKLSRILIELNYENNRRFAKLVKFKYDDDKVHPNIGMKVEFKIEEKGMFKANRPEA